MTQHTTQSMLVDLMRQSRQASKLYASVKHLESNSLTKLAKAQSDEWREANDDLCEHLGNALQQTDSANLASIIYQLRDLFHEQWREAQKHCEATHKKLRKALNQEDYVATAVLAEDIVGSQARYEARRAVHEELSRLIRRAKLMPSSALPMAAGDSSTATPPETQSPRPRGQVVRLRGREDG